jgi:hypothetical protein
VGVATGPRAAASGAAVQGAIQCCLGVQCVRSRGPVPLQLTPARVAGRHVALKKVVAVSLSYCATRLPAGQECVARTEALPR